MEQIQPPEGLDLEQYLAAETMRPQVESRFIKASAANFLLRKGLNVDFDYFEESNEN